ncbi:acyl-CoA dehydrogenase [Halobaculum sp. MBLA0143]|uniref:acyl-CoA dehydrogenase n=1 Tax=Halobaculum sp. MBLA0143 TaxID=3079933 RepID=UPI0035249CAF
MKDGSGDLDFGRDDGDEGDETESDDAGHSSEEAETVSGAVDEGTVDESTAVENPGVDSSSVGSGEETSTGDTGVGSSSVESEAVGGGSGGAERVGNEPGVETERDSGSETPGGDDHGTGSTGGVGSKYPYLVRRSNVGDERGKRLEIHVREHVADREAAFRSRLAELLGTDEVSKTDAREFALVAAMEHPELVAEQMRAEGFDELG